MSVISSSNIQRTRSSSVVAVSLLLLMFALLSLLVHQASTASPSQSGYLGKLELVLVGSTNESLKVVQRDDDSEPDHPWDIDHWLAAICYGLLLAEPEVQKPDLSAQSRALVSGYNLLAPPLRAPPIA
ncbi:hypothetical protein [Nitrincola sp.]|uniref:hypothetical protein n=1 Tax=Nitrincola sp. TaxID=1926584 RepID=UPI003A923E4F